MNKDWLLGFIEGEGCFHIAKPPSFCPLFQLGLKNTIKNRQLLEEIVEFLKENNILYKTKISETHPTANKYESKKFSALYIHVTGVKSCHRLAHFLAPLEWHTEKYHDFLMWKEAIEIIATKEHRNDRGKQELVKVREYMNKHDDRSIIQPKMNHHPLSHFVQNQEVAP